MTAVNHAIVGSVIVAVLPNPVVSIPLAIVSHFALDMLPHFGNHPIAKPGSKEFKWVLRVDGFLLLTFVLLSAFAGFRVGLSWWLLPLGAFLGAIPDIMWLKHYQNDLNGEEKQWDRLRKWHKKIQRYERSWGWGVEVVWFIAVIILLNRVLFA